MLMLLARAVAFAIVAGLTVLVISLTTNLKVPAASIWGLGITAILFKCVQSVLDAYDFIPRGREHSANVTCPSCNQPLRTSKAQQCFECGADWHEADLG